MRNPFRSDLVLLHPPAIYDFREKPTFMGPVADAVPSTAIFEMYPIGLTSIAAFLERNHYNVQIVNLAYRMLRKPGFDVASHVRRLSAPVFGIDLHWLPHAQGALAIAEMVKRLHPQSRVLFGGLSASYYHEELARHPFVDFVLRGDSVEEPVRQLLQALREGGPLESVENLTWKRPDGSLVVNPLSFVPADLDYVDVPAYKYVMRSVFKYQSLSDFMPYLEWLRYPITLVLNARGCTLDCAVCGGSQSAYKRICHRSYPAFRSPEKLMHDIRIISSFSRAPIMMIHDPRMGGMRRCVRIFSLLEEMQPANEFMFELFYPAGDPFFARVQRSVPKWSMEITVESPNEEHRRVNGKFPWSNALLEQTIRSALAHGCRRVDVFFMVGIPHQRYADALQIVDYSEHLLRTVGADGRVRPFVAPLGPFLDPGSRAFEDPQFGYNVFWRTLEDHRRALLSDGWQQMLSYETDGMNRSEIVRATYDVGEQLNELKRRYGLIDERTHASVALRLGLARRILEETERIEDLSEDERQQQFASMKPMIELANHASMFGDDELKAPVGYGFRLGLLLVKNLATGLIIEIGHAAARLAGRFDVAPAVRRQVAIAPPAVLGSAERAG
jgi:B12-binding domain/radical SAM domain protein